MPLEKACIKVLEGCTAGGVNFNKDEKIYVQFNPEKYSVSTRVKYSFAEKEGKLYGQYSGEESRTLSVELFFDMLSAPSVYKRGGTGTPCKAQGLDVLMSEAGSISSAYINRIMALTKAGKDKGAPPMVEFFWGGESLKGVVASASLNYILFNKNGEPTRATLALTFKECDDVLKAGKNEAVKLSSAGTAPAGGLAEAVGGLVGEAEVQEAVIKALRLL